MKQAEIESKIMEAAKGLGAYKMGRLAQKVIDSVDHQFATKGKVAKQAAKYLVGLEDNTLPFDTLIFLLAHFVEHDECQGLLELRFRDLEDAHRAYRQIKRARRLLYHSFEKKRTQDGSRREFRLKLKYEGQQLFFFQMAGILASEDNVTQCRDRIKGLAMEMASMAFDENIDLNRFKSICSDAMDTVKSLKDELEQSA